MSELADLLKQKAEIEAKIRKVKATEVDNWKSQLAKLVTQLREINELPATLTAVFTDKAGTFNAYRTLRIKKP